MKGSLSDYIRIKHALISIEDIETIMRDVSEDDFYRNIEKKLAVLKCLEIISEALNSTSPSVLEMSERPIPLSQIKGLRNIIVHEYFRVDYTQVFSIVKNDLTALKSDLLNILLKIDKKDL